MNRRAFLATLAAGLAGAAADPERLLWVPGRRKIFIPQPPRIFDSRQITFEMLEHLRQHYLIPFLEADRKSFMGMYPARASYSNPQGRPAILRPVDPFNTDCIVDL